MFAVIGRYGRPRSLASWGLFQRIGMASSAPTTAIGMIGHAGPHRDLHEAAAAEAAQLVALAVGLAGALGALGEHEGQLVLLAQEAVGVVGVGEHAADPRPQRADDRHLLEDLVGQAVHGAAELGLDAVHDRRGVGRDGAGVVGHEQRAAVGGDVLEALPLDAVPGSYRGP